MWKRLLDRLAYALIGLVLGVAAAAVLWVLVHAGRSAGRAAHVFDPGFGRWVKVVGLGFAVLGFLIKDRAGSVMGALLDLTCKSAVDRSGGEREMPNWLVAVVVVGLAGAVWYLHRA
jgi:hypothetical protein